LISHVRVPSVVSLLAVAGVLLSPCPAHAQTFGANAGGIVTRAALQASRDARAARRFDLTLDDAVQRALERNLDIAVQRINPLVQDMQVATANAAFLPFASSGFGVNQRTSPNRTLFDGGGLRGSNIINEQGNYDLGVNQRMKWGGGQYDVTWNSSRFETTSIFTTFNPSFGANMTLNYTQPLLRGFRTDPQRTQLVVQRINRDISDIDLEETIVNTLANVRLAYWELVYARAAVDVQRQALELAEQLVRDNRARVEIGTLAPIDVVQAQSEAALRRQLLAQAVQTLRTNELLLKQLIVDGTSDELWDAEINPTDQPQIDAPPIDLDEAIRGALERRTDISRVRQQIDINDAQVDNLRNSTLPALDVVGSYQLTGQGGPRLVPSGSSFEALFGGGGGVIPGGYGDALDNIVDADYPFWSVQLQMTYPLGQSADKAAYERARLQRQQNTAQLRRTELQVASEVTNAAIQIEAIQERIEAAIAARELAEEQLRAEESKFEVGLSTNFLVLQMQRELAFAQDIELRAIFDYQRALIEFDRTQRTSLGAAGITVVGGGGGGGVAP
jgi:outer membrane protein TolC